MLQKSQNTTPGSSNSHRGFTIAQIVLSALGVIDAGLLYLLDTKQVDLPCSADGGCETVANSVYSSISVAGHSIPIAVLGIAGYVIILSMAMAKAASETRGAVEKLSVALTVVTAGSFAYSWYLQYVAHFLIGAFCRYCFASACIMTTLLIVSALELRSLRQTGASPSGKA